MKKLVLLLLLTLGLCSLMTGQCPTPSYTNQMTPLPPNSQVFIGVDDSGTGASIGGISITPDPSDPSPKFTLGAPTPNGVNGGVDFVNGAMQWNQQNNTTGVTFNGNTTQLSLNGIVSTAWPKATVTYHDTSGNQHTVTVDFSANSGSVAVSQSLLDYDANGHLLPTAAGFVTLINTNGTYTVGQTSYPMWDPTGPNFDGALLQNGVHETGHDFLLGDQVGVSGDIMSNWGTTSSDPGGRQTTTMGTHLRQLHPVITMK